MIQKIRQAMQQANMPALLLTSECNRRYATGFHSTAGICYLSQKHACFFTDFRYIEAAKNQIQGWDVQELMRGQSYSSVINTLLQEDKIQQIYLEDDTLTYAAYQKWVDSLVAKVCPLDNLINTLRRVKRPEEVHCIERAQRIAERALAETLNHIKPGVTEKQIAAQLTYLMLLYGAENMSFDPIVVSGIHSSRPHGVPTEKCIEAGDFVTMDFGCIVEGYCSDMTRTVAVGHCTDQMHTIYETVLHAQAAGIAQARTGVTGQSVDAAAREVIAAAGYGDAFGHGFGHGVGLDIHEAPTASPGSPDTLQEGEILTAEPGIYLAGKFGVRIEDMLLIQADGAKNLTNAPKALCIL